MEGSPSLSETEIETSKEICPKENEHNQVNSSFWQQIFESLCLHIKNPPVN